MAKSQGSNEKQIYGEEALITPPGRASYPKLAKPDSEGQYADGKFKTYIIFPEGTDIMEMKKEAAKVARKKWGEKVDLKTIAMPFRKCSEKSDQEGFDEGGIFMNLKSRKRPGILNRKGEQIDGEEIYGGCWIKACVRAGTYTTTEKVVENGERKVVEVHGVTFYLEHVLFWKDDEEFGGSSRTPIDKAFAGDIQKSGNENTGSDESAGGGEDEEDLPF